MYGVTRLSRGNGSAQSGLFRSCEDICALELDRCHCARRHENAGPTPTLGKVMVALERRERNEVKEFPVAADVRRL